MNNRWVKIDDEHWRSLEDENVTVHVNLEEMDGESEDDAPEKVYLVYPAFKDRGIPNSPDLYDMGGYLTLEDAHKAGIKMAKKIMKLPIDVIRRFDWDMV